MERIFTFIMDFVHSSSHHLLKSGQRCRGFVVLDPLQIINGVHVWRILMFCNENREREGEGRVASEDFKVCDLCMKEIITLLLLILFSRCKNNTMQWCQIGPVTKYARHCMVYFFNTRADFEVYMPIRSVLN